MHDDEERERALARFCCCRSPVLSTSVCFYNPFRNSPWPCKIRRSESCNFRRVLAGSLLVWTLSTLSWKGDDICEMNESHCVCLEFQKIKVTMEPLYLYFHLESSFANDASRIQSQPKNITKIKRTLEPRLIVPLFNRSIGGVRWWGAWKKRGRLRSCMSSVLRRLVRMALTVYIPRRPRTPSIWARQCTKPCLYRDSSVLKRSKTYFLHNNNAKIY